jgi:hypothetical protein
VPLGRILLVVAALAAGARLLTLPEPDRAGPAPRAQPQEALAAPTWTGPPPVSLTGRLTDGTTYAPRLYLDPDTSVGLAVSEDGGPVRLVRRGSDGSVVQLRRLDPADHPEFDGFTAREDTLVWAESVSPSDAPVRTSLWRANWRTGGRATRITSDTGAVNFFGGQHDLVIEGPRVRWVSVGPDGQSTEVRSVRLSGGAVTVDRVRGEYALTEWPWAVGLRGGRGTPLELLNLRTDDRRDVAIGPDEVAVCGPTWCRVSVLANDAIVRLDIVRTDGSQRRKVAGAEATPTISDAALLDRFVPLATDRGDGEGVGLSVYDMASGRTDLVTATAQDIQGREGVLWWSTGTGPALVWHALDLRTLT